MQMILLRLLVSFHICVVIGNFAACFVLPFLEPPWISLPLCSFLILVSCSRDQCPLTRLENKLRRKLGMTPIRGFIGHYILGKR